MMIYRTHRFYLPVSGTTPSKPGYSPSATRIVQSIPNLPPSQRPYFFPFFLLPVPLPPPAAGPPPSTNTASSSVLPLLVPVAETGFEVELAAAVLVPLGASSNSFMKSDCILAFFRSHHSRSVWPWACSSAMRARSCSLLTISLADWKIVWPQFGESALACAGGSCVRFAFSWAWAMKGGDVKERAVPLQRRPSTRLQFPFPPVRIAARNHLLHCPAAIMYSARASDFGLRGCGGYLRTRVGGGRLSGCCRGR